MRTLFASPLLLGLLLTLVAEHCFGDSPEDPKPAAQPGNATVQTACQILSMLAPLVQNVAAEKDAMKLVSASDFLSRTISNHKECLSHAANVQEKLMLLLGQWTNQFQPQEFSGIEDFAVKTIYLGKVDFIEKHKERVAAWAVLRQLQDPVMDLQRLLEFVAQLENLKAPAHHTRAPRVYLGPLEAPFHYFVLFEGTKKDGSRTMARLDKYDKLIQYSPQTNADTTILYLNPFDNPGSNVSVTVPDNLFAADTNRTPSLFLKQEFPPGASVSVKQVLSDLSQLETSTSYNDVIDNCFSFATEALRVFQRNSGIRPTLSVVPVTFRLKNMEEVLFNLVLSEAQSFGLDPTIFNEAMLKSFLKPHFKRLLQKLAFVDETDPFMQTITRMIKHLENDPQLQQRLAAFQASDLLLYLAHERIQNFSCPQLERQSQYYKPSTSEVWTLQNSLRVVYDYLGVERIQATFECLAVMKTLSKEQIGEFLRLSFLPLSTGESNTVAKLGLVFDILLQNGLPNNVTALTPCMTAFGFKQLSTLSSTASQALREELQAHSQPEGGNADGGRGPNDSGREHPEL